MNNHNIKVLTLPNLLTLLNLACGVTSLFFIYTQQWSIVILLFLVSGLADFLDGLVARLLNQSNPLGQQLDSLADMVSFGVVPGTIIISLIINTLSIESFSWYLIPPLLIPLAAAIRLAKFNLLEETGGDFKGLSTPAATALIIGWLIIFSATENSLFQSIFHIEMANLSILYIMCLTLFSLMISDISMFSLKFKGLGWKGNELRWIFIILFILLSILDIYIVVFAIVLIYIIVNLALQVYKNLIH